MFVKLIYELSIVHGQQQWFPNHFRLTNGCSWENVQISATEIVSTQGGLKHPILGFMSSALPIELHGPDICYLMFWNPEPGGRDIFVCKVKLKRNVNCARATTLIYDAWIYVMC